jgi:uncharacterized membrane protein YhdT
MSNRSLAKERALWALKPLGFLYLVLWILHPGQQGDAGDMTHMALLGFILGAVYGVIMYRETLQGSLAAIHAGWKDMPNRMPILYYWGNITQVMFDNK